MAFLAKNAAEHQALCTDLVKILYVAIRDKQEDVLKDFDSILFFSVDSYNEFFNKHKGLLARVGTWGNEAEAVHFDAAYKKLETKINNRFDLPAKNEIALVSLASPSNWALAKRRASNKITLVADSAPAAVPTLSCATFFSRLFNCMNSRPTVSLASQEHTGTRR